MARETPASLETGKPLKPHIVCWDEWQKDSKLRNVRREDRKAELLGLQEQDASMERFEPGAFGVTLHADDDDRGPVAPTRAGPRALVGVANHPAPATAGEWPIWFTMSRSSCGQVAPPISGPPSSSAVLLRRYWGGHVGFNGATALDLVWIAIGYLIRRRAVQMLEDLRE